MKIIGILFLELLLLSGCSSYSSLRNSNRANLNLIEVGMPKERVASIMGSETGSGMDGTITNPYRRETLLGLDGRSYDVLFYYTDRIGEKSVETGLTPVVFLDGKVSGIGWTYMDSVVGASTTTIRRR